MSYRLYIDPSSITLRHSGNACLLLENGDKVALLQDTAGSHFVTWDGISPIHPEVEQVKIKVTVVNIVTNPDVVRHLHDGEYIKGTFRATVSIEVAHDRLPKACIRATASSLKLLQKRTGELMTGKIKPAQDYTKR